MSDDGIFKTEDFDEEEIAECLTCGKTDIEDYNDDDTDEKRTNGGVVFTRNGFELFICSRCRYFIENP